MSFARRSTLLYYIWRFLLNVAAELNGRMSKRTGTYYCDAKTRRRYRETLRILESCGLQPAAVTAKDDESQTLCLQMVDDAAHGHGAACSQTASEASSYLEGRRQAISMIAAMTAVTAAAAAVSTSTSSPQRHDVPLG